MNMLLCVWVGVYIYTDTHIKLIHVLKIHILGQWSIKIERQAF